MTSPNPINDLPEGFHARLAEIVGPRGIVTEPADLAPFLKEWRGLREGAATVAVMPANTGEVAAVVKLCASQEIPIVPQGGNTGLCGGTVSERNSVVLSLRRMNRLRALDPIGNSITVEAGCILADVQRIADEHDRLFPLSLAAEGSCQIGGNLSTNAGGTQVLRYGTARELALGLEVVLADGRVLDTLTALRKDNRGYDVKQLFMGSEGTLGIITAATVRLFPKPRSRATALVTVGSVEDSMRLLQIVRSHLGERVTGFELASAFCYELVVKHVPRLTNPLAGTGPWFVLIEATDAAVGGCETMMEAALGEALETEVITDAVIAATGAQADQLWALREEMAEAQRKEGPHARHDVSVPIDRVAAFIEEGAKAVEAVAPGSRLIAFGHLGDGNIHFNVLAPVGMDAAAFRLISPAIEHAVYETTAAYHGSFSAEHGVGLFKTADLERYASPVALDIMRTLKAAMDPKGILNPGKVLA